MIVIKLCIIKLMPSNNRMSFFNNSLKLTYSLLLCGDLFLVLSHSEIDHFLSILAKALIVINQNLVELLLIIS